MSPAIGFARLLTRHPDFAALGLDFHYAWLEGILEAKLTWLKDADDWFNISRWPAGRLFGQAGEYRWQAETDGTLHAVLLLENDSMPPPFGEGAELTLTIEGEDSLIVLYGEWVDSKQDPGGNPDGGPWFYAREIPRPQCYPLEIDPQAMRRAEKGPAPLPRLVVRRYSHIPVGARDFDHGAFSRCVEVTLEARES